MSPEAPEALSVLFRFLDVLEELGVEYHLGGSYASSIHGVPRQTQDIDLVLDIRPGVVDSLVVQLEDEFYLDVNSIRDAIRNKSSVNLIHLDSGIKIDIFIRGDSLYDDEEFLRSRLVQVQLSPERHICVKSAEDIILRKLQWYRLGGNVSEQQWNDVLGIVRVQGDRLDSGYLKSWAIQLEIEDLVEGILAGQSIV